MGRGMGRQTAHAAELQQQQQKQQQKEEEEEGEEKRMEKPERRASGRVAAQPLSREQFAEYVARFRLDGTTGAGFLPEAAADSSN